MAIHPSVSPSIPSTNDRLTQPPTALATKIAHCLATQPDQAQSPSGMEAYSQTGNCRTWYQRGLFLLDAKHYDKALECFNQAIAIDSMQPDIWYTRGEVLANMGMYQDALTCFDQALALKDDSCKAWVFRAVVLIHLQQYQAAIESCDRALAIQPHDPEAWMFRGSALQRLGRYKEAYASFDQSTGIQRQSWWQWLVGLVTLASKESRKAWAKV